MRGARLTACAALAAVVCAAPSVARADDEALVRVIAEQAQVHTGPGFGYRVVYLANRDEVLPAIGRATNDHWYRVRLPDGTYGWILGDEVFPLDVDTSEAHRGPSIWKRMGDAVFSPSPLVERTVGFAFSAGILGGDGMFMFRPSVLLAPHLAAEGFVGETVGDQVDVRYVGAGLNSNFFPSSPVTPFAGFAAGGALGRKKADQFSVKTADYWTMNVGGGLLITLKKRLTIRGDVRHYVIFDANHIQRIEEYSGALCVYF
ncbi:MAG TPA: SH3 domain-containing protein [Polyangia bacterium]|nr:SH3 domain-containing protein [Polyangia bacterium]